MDEWLEVLRYDPIGRLRSTDNRAIEFFCRRDLLEDPGGAHVEDLWSLPEARTLTRRQQEDGSWRYPNPRAERSHVQNYSLLETFRNLGILVEKYGMNRDHPTVQMAAEYLFSCQTGEGDFRGILGNQYMPYYMGAIMELLIKAGYGDHHGIERGFRWLLSVRQDDGGWNIPMRTAGLTYSVRVLESPPVPTDRTKPFSHLITGMALRAFAAHPRYRRMEEALHAARLLKGRFFKRDSIPDRGDPSYWTKFSYPFWFTDLLTSLDSLSLMGFPPEDGEIKKGLDWFVKSQRDDGSWELTLLRGGDKDLKYWLTLAICRVFKRFFH
ncbi:MAG: hypothetical protein FJZ49_05995 [Candidatus Verstraetearchaeota archaeon]|nr:hypothetical protein [Candidatus Verstraetearchaeota archaeon]